MLAAQGPKFTIQDLGSLPNLPSCNGTALSQSGNVVGYCTGQLGQNLLLANPTTHVFLYSNGVMTDLNVTSPPTSVPTGVNDSSTVVGGALSIDLVGATAVRGSAFIYLKGAVPWPRFGSARKRSGFGGQQTRIQMVGASIQVGAGSLDFFIDSKAVLDPLSGSALTQLSSPATGGTAAAFGINSSGVITERHEWEQKMLPT